MPKNQAAQTTRPAAPVPLTASPAADTGVCPAIPRRRGRKWSAGMSTVLTNIATMINGMRATEPWGLVMENAMYVPVHAAAAATIAPVIAILHHQDASGGCRKARRPPPRRRPSSP